MKSETKKIIITILNFVILGANFLLKVLGGGDVIEPVAISAVLALGALIA